MQPFVVAQRATKVIVIGERLSESEEFGWQVTGCEGFVVAQHHGSFDRVVQLPDIASPFRRHQQSQCLLVGSGHSFPHRLGVFLDKELDQFGDIFESISKRRNLQFDSIEPIEQVFLKAAAIDFSGEVPAGRGDDTSLSGLRI